MLKNLSTDGDFNFIIDTISLLTLVSPTGDNYTNCDGWVRHHYKV
jgi:hypothetical protein